MRLLCCLLALLTVTLGARHRHERTQPCIIASCIRDVENLQQHGIRVQQNLSVRPATEESVLACYVNLVANPTSHKQVIVEQFHEKGRGCIGIPISEGEMGIWVDISHIYPVAISPRDALPVLIDKKKFKQFVAEIGYPTYIPIRYESFPVIQYPCILKVTPQLGAGGQGVYIVASEKELRSLLGNLLITDVLVEEFVSSTLEVSVTVVAFRGSMVSLEECIRMETAHEQYIIVGGSTYKRSFIKCSEIPRWDIVKEISTKVVQKLNFTGFGFIQLKYDSFLEPKLVEMNGRIDGTMRMYHPGLFASLIKKYYRAWSESEKKRERKEARRRREQHEGITI